MDIALLVARLVLAAVLTLAGVAKLADLNGSRQAMRNFGIPLPYVAPLGVLLPLAELTIAVALIPRETAWWAASAALALLLAFTAGIGANLARGRKPDCHCFGQLYSSSVGWPALIRNGVLALVAGFIVLAGRDDAGTSVVAWVSDMTTGVWSAVGSALLGLLLVLVAGDWVMRRMLGKTAQLSQRLDALENAVSAGSDPTTAGPNQRLSMDQPPRTKAPEFTLEGLHGETVTLEDLRGVGKRVMLIFTDPGCGVCTALLPEIERWQRDYSETLTLAVLSRGTVESNRAKVGKLDLHHVLLEASREVSQAYMVVITPTAVLIRPDGTIASHQATGPQAIRMLMARTVEGFDPSPPVPANGHAGMGAPVEAESQILRVGDPAPPLRLPNLDGNEVSLTKFAGKQILLLFWNPDCRFSTRMLPDMLAWEEARPPEAPRLLVVSTGNPEANRKVGLRSTVVLDSDFAIGEAVGARGTPSAVLVDAEGKIASSVAVGAKAIFDLAGLKERKDNVVSV